MYRKQDLILYYLKWSCEDECKYECMWKTVKAFNDRNWRTPQFYGKWPFVRFLGMQEPASVVFSILNAYFHFNMMNKFRKEVRPDSPLTLLWHIYFMVLLLRFSRNMNKKFEIWNFFSDEDNGKAKCNICKCVFSYRTSVSNLKSHIVRKHPSVKLGQLERFQKRRDVQQNSSQTIEGSSSTPSEVSSENTPTPRSSIMSRRCHQLPVNHLHH
ncbi:unnamed protein product [Acanthoscelides obtectus]|nr:unnamed protein product [Acanthoscelides obtectus]CAK1624360.1 Post-GPI attachment to proteins factor 3 [Acanthoscelides obtectus]